jgi:hypothetical protein
MALTQAFAPFGNTANLSISSTSGVVQFNTQTGGASGFGGGYQVRLYNNSSSTVFIAFGSASSATAALGTGMPMAANSVEVFTVPFQTAYVAAIAAAAGGTLYATPGEGV